MRTLSVLAVLFFFTSAQLSAQIIPPPQARSAASRATPAAEPAPVPGVYLVTFRPGTPAADRATVVQGHGARLRAAYQVGDIATVQIPDAAVLARLRNDPRVLGVYTNQKFHLDQGRGGNGKPNPPESLAAVAASSSVINLSWLDASTNENGFAIERCTGSVCSNFAEIFRTGADVVAYADSGRTAETVYRYRVRAFNGSGNSKYSNTAQATTPAAPPPPPTAPAAPSNLTATPTSHTQVDLAWSDNSNNENGFRLERCTGAGCTSFAEITTGGPNAVAYSDSGRTAQTVYRYRVLAFNAVGDSAYSSIAEATTPAAPPPPPPAAPSGLTATPSSHTQVDLSWSDNSSSEDGFRLERCTGADCTSFVEIFASAADVTTYNDAGRTAQTVYRYRVLAFNAGGDSAYSTIAEATTSATPPPPPPAAPSGLTATPSSHTQVDLSWSDNSSSEDGFRLERCTGAGCMSFVEIFASAADVTTYNDAGRTAQTVYRYRVLAFNAGGSSAYSSIVDATTPAAPPPPPPAAPSGLSATPSSHTQVDLSWADNSSSEDGFRLERCTGAGCTSFVEIFASAADVTTYNDTGRTAQTVYRYRVLAFNTGGSSAYSTIADATTPAAPSAPPPAAPSGLTAAPISYSQVELNWSDNSSNESGFRIERCTGPMASCSSFAEIGQVPADIIAAADTGLQALTTYTYRVRSFNADGQSAYSNSAQATTPAVPPNSQVVPAGVQRIGTAPGALSWTGAGVGVAVLDTGLDFGHADLPLLPEIPNTNSFHAVDPGTSCQDIHGHGTHVAGIIGAKNNLIDAVGVAPGSTVYCVNVFEPDPVEGVSATDESVIAGLNWILTHANTVTPRIRVVNMSLGRAKTFQDNDINHPLRVAVRALYNAGISVVVAAGNDPLTEVIDQVPAFYPEVMAVASTTAEEGVNGYDTDFPACVGLQSIKADTASYFTTDGSFLSGSGVTISAPGGTREDIFEFAGSCFLEPIGILSLASGGGTVELSGTSMASPHVAGVVALMWEKEISLGLNLSPETARTRIRDNAIRRGTAPLDSMLEEYTFDGQREGVIYAPSALLESPPPPIDAPPTVTIVSPANNASFSSGANITFSGTATDPEDGNIAASLAWTSSRDGAIGTGANFTRTLTNGIHVITTSLLDSGGNSAGKSVSISVGSPATPTTVHAASVTYALVGSTLRYTVKLENEFGGPVAGAAVRVSLYEWIFSGFVWFANGVTDSQGNAQFQLLNADVGCYVTGVENVTAAGLTWVPGTPNNNYCIGL